MKYKALLKDALIEIKKSLGRFLSIFAIVAIGVSFFAGVKASAPAMKYTADKYYDDYNLMDFTLKSTMGFTDGDIEAIKKVDSVEGIYASHSIDTLVSEGSTKVVVKALSYPMNSERSDPNYINQPRLIEGRLPKNENECVLEYTQTGVTTSLSDSQLGIGNSITLMSGSDDTLEDTLKNTTYEIVGLVNIPYYLSHDKGSTSIGNGSVNKYIIIPDTNFTSDIYTEAYLSIKNTKSLNSYHDDYFKIIDNVNKELKKTATHQTEIRIDEVRSEANEKITDSVTLYDANKLEFDSKIEAAQLQINANETKLNDSIKQYNEGLLAYNNGRVQFENSVNDLTNKKNELNTNLSQLNSGISLIEQALSNPLITQGERDQYNLQLQSLTAQKQEVLNGITQIDQVLSNTPLELASKKLLLDQANVEINNGTILLNDAKNILATQKSEGEEKLNSAAEQITSAKSEIEELKTPDWYILDRKSHYSYMEYGNAADSMDSISKIFPIFFFVVAALVCLTSMTRMVDEQRQEIGTLKALGYGKLSISFKFILYAAMASIFGGIFGAVIGMILFPIIVFNAWGIMYSIPSIQIQMQLDLALISILLASCTTILATIFACYKQLMETPSLLMRPKAPKNGKKILLEHIPILWNRLSFTYKVTARNIFRYKKRFFMTIIGISGCTALLVAGFGIQDSIGQVVKKQYGDIYKYDVSITLDRNLSSIETSEVQKELNSLDNIKSTMKVGVYNGIYTDNNGDKGISINVVQTNTKIDDFYTFKNRKSDTILSIRDDGILISEKLAADLNLSIDDYIKVDNGNGINGKLKINGIMENYVGHNIYMSPNYYKDIYNSTSKNNEILAILHENNKTSENLLGEQLLDNDNIESVSFFSGIAKSFNDTITSLIAVVIVLIISAGLLAFVVLYNLSTVNISERLREIATIKVLGFYDREVSSYVYRENLILTLIGSLVGLVLGISLHSIIMQLAELDSVMFGRNIEPLSFIASLAMTMMFSLLVNLVMYRKLQKIEMVESLKSVE